MRGTHLRQGRGCACPQGQRAGQRATRSWRRRARCERPVASTRGCGIARDNTGHAARAGARRRRARSACGRASAPSARLRVVDGEVGEHAVRQVLRVRVQHVLVQQQQLVGLSLQLRARVRSPRQRWTDGRVGATCQRRRGCSPSGFKQWRDACSCAQRARVSAWTWHMQHGRRGAWQRQARAHVDILLRLGVVVRNLALTNLEVGLALLRATPERPCAPQGCRAACAGTGSARRAAVYDTPGRTIVLKRQTCPPPPSCTRSVSRSARAWARRAPRPRPSWPAAGARSRRRPACARSSAPRPRPRLRPARGC